MMILLALFDRMRGGGWFRYSHLAGMLGMGVVVSLILNLHGWVFGYGVLAVMLGASFGWGNPLGAAFDGRPMGSAYEWWQVGILRRSVILALLARGAMWGIPLAPMIPLAPVAFAIPFALSPYLARVIPWRGDRWAILEFTRGAMTGSLLYLVR